ncbi:transcription factor IIA, alpha/beta subunit [Hymenopellis radicata]|nr:transcription factor IIA, alpha/beta subunit [Hymenopellis radicata]
MSNKIVPNVYRAVIDDVMESIKPEFEEYGVPEDVLAQLQAKWEEKVVASHVAEFETPPAQQQQQQQAPQPQHAYAVQHPQMHMMPSHPHYAAPTTSYAPTVKTEPIDARYILAGSQGLQYSIPTLPGPQLGTLRAPPHLGGQAGVLTFQAATAQATTSTNQQQAGKRIPQADGPSEDSDESPSPPPFAPHSNHPSLPQRPVQPAPASQESEAINSDLDDSDTENEADAEDGAGADSDIVFCTYDKVARVKNKWKCILKDGMIHVNGKDYLFQKCTGEFEW